jgi:nucleoside-diphosphate-sugar epimerase
LTIHVLVTGASGFVGSAFVRYLANNGFKVTAASRKNNYLPHSVESLNFSLEDLFIHSVITEKFDVVVHLAGLAHRDEGVSKSQYMKINNDATLELARQSALNGMKRFIFISTIGVNGENTFNSSVFDEFSDANPCSDYAFSKYQAEINLRRLSEVLNFELVVVRPPLIYGENAPGNFAKLVSVVKNYSVFPFGTLNNKRSFISLNNFVNFLTLCIIHSKAKGELFLISDGDFISTKKLMFHVASKLDKKLIQLPVPVFFMFFFACLIGKRKIAFQLLGDLQINSSKARNLLGWLPVESIDSFFSSHK